MGYITVISITLTPECPFFGPYLTAECPFVDPQKYENTQQYHGKGSSDGGQLRGYSVGMVVLGKNLDQNVGNEVLRRRTFSLTFLTCFHISAGNHTVIAFASAIVDFASSILSVMCLYSDSQ